MIVSGVSIVISNNTPRSDQTGPFLVLQMSHPNPNPVNVKKRGRASFLFKSLATRSFQSESNRVFIMLRFAQLVRNAKCTRERLCSSFCELMSYDLSSELNPAQSTISPSSG